MSAHSASFPDVQRDEPNANLDTVLIGGRERRPVVIAEYDPRWPARFERERARIAAALGPVARAVEHVGSTSVPGLAAKPVIDVLVAVEDPADERAFVPALEAAGYVLRVREPGHRMLRTPERDVHVHVWAAGDAEIERKLGFRDRLRSSAEDRAAYEALKRGLAQRDWEDMNDYANAKGPLIEAILARAEGAASGPPTDPAAAA
jgi:GrpB-like predicted nucleotidyltransferase (UPF0157 family)